MNMRELLKQLMDARGDDAYSLEVLSGVPQPTTNRFLNGKHGEPRSSTVQKWAKAYGITESQLRGDVPLPAGLLLSSNIQTSQTEASSEDEQSSPGPAFHAPPKSLERFDRSSFRP